MKFDTDVNQGNVIRKAVAGCSQRKLNEVKRRLISDYCHYKIL